MTAADLKLNAVGPNEAGRVLIDVEHLRKLLAEREALLSAIGSLITLANSEQLIAEKGCSGRCTKAYREAREAIRKATQ